MVTRTLVQLFLIVCVAAAAVVSALLAGTLRGDFSRATSQEILMTPEARAELAADVANELVSAVPILQEVPDLDVLVLAAADAEPLDRAAHGILEQGIDARFGGGGPIMLGASDIVGEADPILAAALASVPSLSIELEPHPVERAVVAARVGAPVLLMGAMAGFVVVQRTVSAMWAAMLVGIGGLVAAVVLLLVPLLAAHAGPMSTIVASRLASPTTAVAVAALSLLTPAIVIITGAKAQ